MIKNSLAVQWLGLGAFTVARVQSLVGKLILQATWHGQKKKHKKNPDLITMVKARKLASHTIILLINLEILFKFHQLYYQCHLSGPGSNPDI